MSDLGLPARPGFGEVIDPVAKARQEGAEKALFYALCALEQIPVAARAPGESEAGWQGRYKALCEAALHMVGEQICAGRLNLRPLPRAGRKGGEV